MKEPTSVMFVEENGALSMTFEENKFDASM